MSEFCGPRRACAVGVLVYLIMALAPGAARATSEPVAEPLPWVVAVSQDPPFSMKTGDGQWTGIAVELWERLATRLHIPFELVELRGAALAERIGEGRVDVVLAAIVDPSVEEVLDLTHAYHSTGLGIAVEPTPASGWTATLGKLASAQFLKVIGALLLVILSVGTLMWLAERRRNAAEFGGSAPHGIWEGTWWSAVTMTTVGYGDKSPRTLPGRLLGLVWMFAAILIISSFTARIASSLTVDELATKVNGPDDLARVRVGVVQTEEYDVPGAYLTRRQIPFRTYATAEDMLAALDAGHIDAAVYEQPTLQYYVSKKFAGRLKVLPGTFDNHGYAFALHDKADALEPINLALLQEVTTDPWRARVQSYLRP